MFHDRAVLKNKLGIDLDAPKGTIDIFSVATNTETNQDHIARIQTWAGYDKKTKTYGSKIALKADVAEIDAAVTKIGTDTSELVEIKAQLVDIAGAVSIKKGYLSATIAAQSGSTYYCGGSSIGFDQHSHKISVINGKVYFGEATSDTNQSFKIADTKFYKDKVKALTVTSLNPSTTLSDGRYTITVTAKNADGDVLKSYTWTTSKSAYNAGVSDGANNVHVSYLEERPTGVRVHLDNGHSQFFSGWHK